MANICLKPEIYSRFKHVECEGVWIYMLQEFVPQLHVEGNELSSVVRSSALRLRQCSRCLLHGSSGTMNDSLWLAKRLQM